MKIELFAIPGGGRLPDVKRQPWRVLISGTVRTRVENALDQFPSLYLGVFFIGIKAALGQIVGDGMTVVAPNAERNAEIPHHAH
jgi:hypothetical protein